MRVFIGFLASAFLVFGDQAGGQTPPSVHSTLEALYKVHGFRGTAISPNGRELAWVETLKKANGTDSRDSAIYVAPVNDPSSRLRITATGGGQEKATESGVSWSPDSSRIVFVSDAEQPGQPEIYVVEAHGGTPRKLTSLKGYLAAPRFSPDGKEVAFLFTENAPRVAGPLAPSTPEIGVIDQKIYEQRIAVLNIETGGLRVVTPSDLYVYEYDWSPDGQQFAYTAAPGVGDNNWWVAQLYRISANKHSAPELVVKPPAQIAVPRWSPDGQSIAFIGGIMSDEGSTGGDIYLAPADGGSISDLTPGRKSNAAWLDWLSSGKLLFGEDADGGVDIAVLNPRSREAEVLWKGNEQIRFGGVALDGTTSAIIRTSWDHAPEVWAGPIGDWHAVTTVNAGAQRDWGKAEKIKWTNGGYDVDGWLLFPANFDPQKRYPLVVSVHGGPAAQKAPSWPSANFDLSILATQGYFVFFPNPRGSYGEGEAFTHANVKDFGYGDLADILTGVDQVLKLAPIDPDRIGVGGWSYGGYMTMWAVTQTHRFKAAVAGAGIANWQSYYGQNLIDQWMIPYFGASVYDDPAVYAKSSPITYIKNVKTPTLIVVGDRDAECPMPQSREFWHALQTLGVKTQFVVYPNEGHHFNDPAHVQDVLERTINWFQTNL
ncbi:MAG TPA: S9 family peptidase [Bryobacteraceae bacterium]|jgi:dipeptidyl aminopeptidase/acylaminoacyl peptidase|nr:S9 family peptidase [Bryobacteraceae bacterium]